MKKLLLTLVLVVLSIFNMQASITASDLNGKYVSQVLVGDMGRNGLYLDAFVGYFTYENDVLYLNKFLGQFKMPCDIAVDDYGNTLMGIEMDYNNVISPMAGTYDGSWYHDDVRFRCLDYNGAFKNTDGNPLCWYTNNDGITYLMGIVDETSGVINMNSLDRNAIYSVPFLIDKESNPTPVGNDRSIFSGVRLTLIDDNAMAYDYDQDGNVIDEYPVGLVGYTQNGVPILSIVNWMNTGALVESWYDNSGALNTATGDISGQVDTETKTISISATGVNLEVKNTYVGYGQQPYYSGGSKYYLTGHFILDTGLQYTQYYVSGNAGGEYNADDPITGRYDNTLSHDNYEKDAWVTNDGSVKTFKGYVFEFDDYIYHDRSNVYGEIYKTVIKPYNREDVTAEVELVLNCVGVAENHDLYANATIKPVNNCENVEKFELFVIPERHSSINTFSSGHHSYEKGHVRGVNITDCTSDFHFDDANAVAMAANNEEQTLNVYTNLEEYPANLKDFTFYVKTTYKQGTGLEPTYHSMQSPNVVTAVEDVMADGSYLQVKGYKGYLEIIGSDGNATVTTASGTVLYQGGDGTIDVAPGMYIVHAGKTVRKVIVR